MQREYTSPIIKITTFTKRLLSVKNYVAPIMFKIIAKMLVTSCILWTNLDLSIGQDYNNSSGEENVETSQLIDWDYETIMALRWGIDNPPLVEYDKLRFDIRFTVSDYIEVEKHVRYDTYQNSKCGDADDVITDSDGYMKTFITEDDTPVGTGIDENIKRTVTVSNLLVAQNITRLKSYKEAASGTGDVGAYVTYCVRFSLWNGDSPSDPNAAEINHSVVTVGLNLDLIDEDFNIMGQKVEAQNIGIERSDDQFFVEAFICDKTGKQQNLITPARQGDTIRVCIQPTKQAAEVGFRMQRIERFNFFQGVTSQLAILNAEVAPNFLTNIVCQPGAKQCAVETLLFSYFFQNSPGSGGTVFGSGEATLQWGGEGVARRLQFHGGPQLLGIEVTEERASFETEEDGRLLQDRGSRKTIQVPDFAILADDGRKRPRLLADSKSSAGIKPIILTSLFFIFCGASFPLLVRYHRGQRKQTTYENTPAQSMSQSSDVVIESQITTAVLRHQLIVL